MTLTFLLNGCVNRTIYNADVSSIASILDSVDFTPSEIKDRTVSPCYEDGAIYVTLWDSHSIVYQFILYASYSQYNAEFIAKIDDIIRHFNSSLKKI